MTTYERYLVHCGCIGMVYFVTACILTKIDFKEKFTAIKIHFGELGNLSFIRPNYAKVVADYVKELGGRPFLTDCNTLYVGTRKNALDHLETAYLNGFSPLQTGCHVIIADGLKGTEETLIPINQEYVKNAKIGSAIASSDIVISVNHFKGHEMAGFGGAVKNLGMGSGSRAGKMEQHCEGKPYVKTQKCVGCGACKKICAHKGPEIKDGKASINMDKCVGCGRCIAACPKDAIDGHFSKSLAVLNYKMAEYALAVVKDKPNFHITLIMDVSPDCDCHAENDIPIIPDIGMLAGFDPVALDQAASDMCNAQQAVSGSVLSNNITQYGRKAFGGDVFSLTHPDTEWDSCLEHAQKIGLGNRKYELVKI